jgi:[protein-PII] uridylyltransferase
LTAQIFSRTDGIALDTFFGIDAKRGGPAGSEQRDSFEQALNKTLNGQEVDFAALIARQKVARPAYQPYAGQRIPTRTHFDNESSETRTLMEIETEDRIGLLYAITETLSTLDLDISAARICTEKGAAIDSFYFCENNGRKVLAPERQRSIERHLRQAIHKLDAK